MRAFLAMLLLSPVHTAWLPSLRFLRKERTAVSVSVAPEASGIRSLKARAQALSDDLYKQSLQELGIVRVCRLPPIKKTLSLDGVEWQEMGLAKVLTIKSQPRFLNVPIAPSVASIKLTSAFPSLGGAVGQVMAPRGSRRSVTPERSAQRLAADSR
jgi:hypothetical protein